MNRAERRRRAKQPHQSPTPQTPTTQSHNSIASVKSALQQATSPEDVHHVIQALIAQGLPPTAGEELHVYAAEFHDATAFLQDRGKKDDTNNGRVARLVDNAHDWADSKIDQSMQKAHRACRAGCAFCCYLPAVLVTAAEAVHLANWLHEHCARKEIKEVKRRASLRLQAQAVEAKKPMACPLLQDNRCMAYEARPLKCRGWNSLSLSHCETSYGQSETSLQIPIDTYAYVMANTVLNGLTDSLNHTGHDGATYDLSHALYSSLDMDIPDLNQRWQNGQTIFTAEKQA